MLKVKSKEWLKRYLPAEISGTVMAIFAASIAHYFYSNHVLIAYVGSLGEAVGFYSTVFFQNIYTLHKKTGLKNKKNSIRNYVKIISGILIEFGPAGIIDGFLLRPLFMYLFPMILSNFTLGILIGKIAGDITFYMLVILSYEYTKYKNSIKKL